MRIRPSLLAGLGTALLLAACDRSAPPPPPAENDAMTAPEPVAPPAPPPQVVELPKPEATPKPKPAPELSPDQQVQEDADATGMTARANRGDEDAGDSQPATGAGNDQD